MKVLHISVAGIVDKFYLTFLSQIKSDFDVDQTLYIPFREKEYAEEDMKILDEFRENNIKPVALPIKTAMDRLLYKRKICKYAEEIEKREAVGDYNIIHAHSLFSDGGVAYLLNKKYSVPYIVAVRTTDTSVFMKCFPHLRVFGRKILENAEKVIFITPSLKKDTFEILYKNSNANFLDKNSCIIPNGIKKFWIDNLCGSTKIMENNEKVKIIQVSRLKKRKNVDKAIEAISILRRKGINATLDVLGEGEERNNLEKLIRDLKLEEYVSLHGFISDLAKVKEYYNRNDIFVMPSTDETFGLTYIEAMSQGLPIIGINNTGVSGFFKKDTVGCFINKPVAEQIVEATEQIIYKYKDMSQKCIESVKEFDWEKICHEYVKMYKKYGKY